MATLDLVTELDETLTEVCHAYEITESCKNTLNDIYNLKILNFNIRSLQKNFDAFLVALKRLDINFDVIVLTECHLGTSSLIRTIPGYAHFCTSVIANQAGGVVAYVRADWDVNVSEPNISEADSIIIDLPNSHSILGIYRSPSFVNIGNFLASLDDVLKGLTSSKRDIITIGDMNINLLDDNIQTNDYLCLTAELGLKHLINIPTRGSSCLDHILVDVRSQATGVVCKTDVTDHDLVMAGFITNFPKSCRNRCTEKTNYEAIYNELKSVNWSDILLSDDVSVTANILTTRLETLVKKHTSRIRVSRRKHTLKEWITPGLLKCMKRRDALHMITRKNPNDAEALKTYKRYRNVFFDLMKDLKTQHNKKQFMENKDNPRKLWKTVKSVCELKTKKDSNPELLKIESNPSESLNVCNNYFVNVGQNLANSIMSKVGKSEEDLASNVRVSSCHPDSFFMSPTDPVEIVSMIKALKNDKAPGRDGLRNSFIKTICPLVAEPLTHIINLSLQSGIFPDCWKVAAVVPIHKEGSKLCACNYRPISLLPVFSKILEKVVNNRLVKFLEAREKLTPFQFGFRQNRSTEDAVTLLLDNIASSIDNGLKCIGVFLDLAKAFDTVSPKILLRKLDGIGIRGSALDWFASYLSSRRQHVSLNGYTSHSKTVSFGVPQGSILGPTLFIVYVNDLADLLTPQKDAQIVCYADDTAILFKGKSWAETFDRAESGLERIASWLDSNLLTLNTNKTKYLCFQKTSASNPSTNHEIKIHECKGQARTVSCSCPKIDRAESIKYLGVILDEKLSFKPHINVLSGRVRKIIPIMKLLRDGADKDLLMLVYTALCQTILSYCILAWGGAAKTFMVKVERAQRSVLKVMFRKPYRHPTTTLYEETKTMTVRQLYIHKAILSHHKHTKLTPVNPDTPVKRRRIKVDVPFVRSAFASRFSYHAIPFIYKRAMKHCNLTDSSLHGAKVKVKKWLLSLDYDATECLLIVQR